MREPAPGGHDAIGEAARRLDRALTRLEKLVAEGRDPSVPDQNPNSLGPDLFGHSAALNAELAAELDAARAREQALHAAAMAASEALGRAADEVRLALGDEDETAEDETAEDETAEDETGETAGAEPEGHVGDGQGDPPTAPDALHPDKEPAS